MSPTIPRLPAELWQKIFVHLHDPIYILHTCRIVSRDFRGYTKNYFKAYFIPRGTMYRHWSGFDCPRYEGIFSCYSVDGNIVRFDLAIQKATEAWQGRGLIYINRPRWLDIVHTKSPEGLYEDLVYAFSPDGYVSRNTTIVLASRNEWRLGREGAVELVLDLEGRFVEFAWWEVIIKLLLVGCLRI
jgi:hypothetical protein